MLRYNINMRLHLVIFILFFGAFLSRGQTAWACTPQPDYWFAEVYSTSSMLLPENVTIDLSPRDSAKGYLLIHNYMDTPLYVLPHDGRAAITNTQEPTIAEEGLAGENSPKEILLFDQVPNLAIFTITKDAPLRLDTDNLPDLVPYIEDRNILDFSRPGLIFLPITQRGEFHLVHDDQIFTIQFAISYALNEYFDPIICGEEIVPSAQQEVPFSNETDNSITISTIVFGIIVLVTWGAILRIRNKLL
jgi:hypothetical protein